MKILFVAEFFPMDEKLKFTGGVEAYNFYLVRELSKKNKVTVLCRNTGKINFLNNCPNLTVIPVGPKARKIDTGFMTIPGRFLFIIQSIVLGIKTDFDVVQGNNFVTLPIAFLIGFFKNKPKIAWYADVFLGEWIKHTGVISGLVGEIAERVILKLPWTHFVSLSKSTLNKLKKSRVDTKKISVILAGVDLDYFNKIPAKKAKIPTIICISRLVRYKRVDLLIEACKILDKKGVNFKLNVIGDGPKKEQIKKLINRYHLSKKVTLEEKLDRDELAGKLKSASVLCHPSEQEGFGLVVIEAAACGVPFVISDLEVLKEITKNGQGGLIFKSGQKYDLAASLEKIIKDKNLEKKLGQQVLELAANYSWSEVARRFESIYVKNK